jgi:hypothetical protein
MKIYVKRFFANSRIFIIFLLKPIRGSFKTSVLKLAPLNHPILACLSSTSPLNLPKFLLEYYAEHTSAGHVACHCILLYTHPDAGDSQGG